MSDDSPFKRLTNINEAKVIKVIEIKSIIGKGIEGDPIIEIAEYYSEEGELLARRDRTAELGFGIWEKEEYRDE
jgi:hypothetical protein